MPRRSHGPCGPEPVVSCDTAQNARDWVIRLLVDLMPDAQKRRFMIACLMRPIALPGLSPLGQVRVQFMMVWHR